MNIEKSSQTEWHGRIFAVSALPFVLFLFLLLRQQCGIPFGELGHLKMRFPSAEQMEQWHAEQKKGGMVQLIGVKHPVIELCF